MILNQNNFEIQLNKNYYFENNPSVAVSVSGGPDSMALLFLVNKLIKKKKGKVIALIVDHKIRENSNKEANSILDYLKKNSFDVKILSIRKSKVSKKSMNEARFNRYEILTKYCIKNKIIHLFLGHHKDDNLETYLNRKIAGSDFEGLQSINKYNLINKTIIIRPLLNFTKKQIYKYNKKNNIFFVEDPSNLNENYTRPILRKFIKNQKQIIKKQLDNEFLNIRNKVHLYKFMISEIFINIVDSVDRMKIKIEYINFFELDELIAEKIIKKIYEFFFSKNIKLRSKKIQILLKLIKNDKFNFFNLKGLSVKKTNNFLIFSQINTNLP